MSPQLLANSSAMLQTPAAPSNWPHAIDSLYDNGKRRRKQYFPDGLPGMYLLSKTEVADDIDLIEADADRTGFSARRRACRSDAKDEAEMDLDLGEIASGVQNGNGGQNKASKRQRLLERILDEHGIREDARVELTKARRALDDIGEQILAIGDETARVERHIAQCKAEEDSLKRILFKKHSELQQITEEFEQIRTVFLMKIDAETENITKTEEQIDVFVRYEQTLAERNNAISSQQKEIEALKHELSVLKQCTDYRQAKTEPVYHNGVVEVEEASGSVGTPSIDFFMQRCSTELQDFTNHVKTLTVHLTDIEQQKIDLEQRLRHSMLQLESAQNEIKKQSDIEAQLKAENAALKENVERAQGEAKKIAKMTEHLSCDVEMGNERIAAFQMVVEAADQRVRVAEQRLHEVTHAQAVLKGANIQLQRKLTQLAEQYQALKQERDGLEMDLAGGGNGSPPSPLAQGFEDDRQDNNVSSNNVSDIYDNGVLDDNGDGETMASGVVQQSPMHPEEVTTTVRKVGRPSNKSLASRRRSSRA